MQRFILCFLEQYLNQFNEYKETNYELVGIRHANYDTDSEIVLDLYDRTTKEKRPLYLFEFRDKLLGEIKEGIVDRINNNEFQEAKKLMEIYKSINENLE